MCIMALITLLILLTFSEKMKGKKKYAKEENKQQVIWDQDFTVSTDSQNCSHNTHNLVR